MSKEFNATEIQEKQISSNTQNRLKSKVFWAAMIAQVLALLLFTGVINVAESEAIEMGIGIILEFLVSFGVLNNPTSKDSF